MSVRRRASSVSLSRYARPGTPDYVTPPGDFCNAFWGLGDSGVDVLFARMRCAMTTTEELMSFWKERAILEERYARGLADLARFTIGKHEIGEMRGALDTLKNETAKQAEAHLIVANGIKTGLETPTLEFLRKQQQHRREKLTAVDKELKMKRNQEGYVVRAREKYEADCNRIKDFAAQSVLLQGVELDRLRIKHQRTLETVQANRRDYANFVRGLQEATQRWEDHWRAFCDGCQDLEEERIEFLFNNVWAYTDAVSTVCVSVDNSCEIVRLALEQLETEKEIGAFLRTYGTGNVMPDPPPFIDFENPDLQYDPSQPPSSHPANYPRQSHRFPTEDAANRNSVGSPTLSINARRASMTLFQPSAVNGRNGTARPPQAVQGGGSIPQSPSSQQRYSGGSNGSHPSHPPHAPPQQPPPPVPLQPQPQYPHPQPSNLSTPAPAHVPTSALATAAATAPAAPCPARTYTPIFFSLSPVQAIFGYTATTEEEFDFQKGDIIAVTATPPDGWWSGELLDDTRRQPGHNVFPSNFVALLM
ncbi:uncharacterized protein BXZ73DRAFT_41088 [Epithele typhae]|uniref:uncharacterized protein n=1 Tax=Epithele typhae TaxID=378194 RepID=UPI0020086D0C|nr:uncharacterized protein BXZ73DRAFT_41088 [Epithele typhae]KAH9942151.1 hypothetical protein BXZ73DRAFT_41088 [Epithele typhae]